MSRTIFCHKLQQDALGLEHPPLPGATGQKIFDLISAQAWELWLAHQTMLINEYRLSLLEDKSREFLQVERDKFLFGKGSDKPGGYVPPESA